MTIPEHTSSKRNPLPAARSAVSYRAARRNEARKRKLRWRELPHLYQNDRGQIVVALPPVVRD